MRCKSGKHEWTEALDASRCCSAYWRRDMRMRGQEDDLDPAGRQVVTAGGVVFVWGWVATEDGRELAEGLAGIAPPLPGI
jgi:hypothetical protein